MNPELPICSTLSITINGQVYEVEPGISVAAALAVCEVFHTRLSVTGIARAPVCGMGVCQECRVTINGQRHQLACQTLVTKDMQVLTGALV
ncbi:(2Fe-2S)-binding protein [Undibacterium sp. Di24W]|uniref:(2Fe-2S)-binding protein n=1 Tax=Undibacterium sp. Di24W TaxID=3413033 RepID=UPI003BF29930